MDNYKLTVAMEPTDKYEKARQDLLQAMNSIRALSSYQQRRLCEEFFGAANVAAVYAMMQQYYR